MILLSLSALASDFVDTWIVSSFEETNVLAGPEAYSPAPNFVQRGNNTFFETYETRFTDDLSATHLVLYRKDDGFTNGWMTEAAFVLRLAPVLNPDSSKPSVDVQDDGTYIRVIRSLGAREDHTVSLTGYVIDANRFRLGYSYDLTWGGRQIYSFDPSAAPGVRLQYQNGDFYAFAGVKTAVGDWTNPETGEKRNQAYFGSLFGLGGEIGSHLRLEGGAGTFQQGQLTNVSSVTSPLYNAPINAMGASAQIGFRTNDDVNFATSNELKLYRNAPEFVRDSYISHRQIDGVAFLVQAEVNVLAHNLIDPADEGQTRDIIEKAIAGDVQMTLVASTTEVGLDLVHKDLPYILFNIPGITSGYAINHETVEISSQEYVRAYVSHWFPEAHIAPSLGVGYMLPASYCTGGTGDCAATGSTYVQYSERDKEHTPAGQGALALLSSVVGLQWDITPSTVAVAEVLYTVDNNRSTYSTASGGDTGTRTLAPANERNELGFNLMLRARF